MKLPPLKVLIALFIVVTSFTISSGASQQKDFYFNHIRTEQGLSNGTINEMLRDRAGFLWIATLNGLNCFDGHHFLVWKANPADSNQLMNDAIFSLCEDDKGDIWCTSNAGVSRYDRLKNRFSNFFLVNAVTAERAVGTSNGIICTRQGVIVTYSSSGVFVFDKREQKFIHYPEIKSTGGMNAGGVINKSFVEDPFKNGVWLGTGNGLKYFDLDTKVYFSYKNNPYKSEVFTDHYSGPLCLDNEQNLVYADAIEESIKTFSFRTGKVTALSTRNWMDRQLYFDCMMVDRDSNLWLSADNTDILFYEHSSGKNFVIEHKNELSHSVAGDCFLSAFQDDKGTIYLGTVNGISYINLDRNFITVFRFPDSVSHFRKYYLHQLLNCDKQNNIWFAPSYNSLLEFKSGDQSYKTYDILKNVSKEKWENINISTMEPDEDKLYFGTIDGIYVFETATETFYKWKAIPPSERIEGKYIFNLLLAVNKELWFTSHHNGLFRVNTLTGEYQHYLPDSTDASSFTSQYIFDMEEDRNGDIWFCAEKDGIIKFDREKNNFRYVSKKAAGVDPEVYFSFAFDSENDLWTLGFLSGLKIFDTKTNSFVQGLHIEGLSNNQYNHIAAGSNGSMLLSYYAEYSLVDTRTKRVKNFQVDFARSNNDYANYSCLMPDGRIVTESRNAFFIFNTAYLGETDDLEPVTISNFSAGQAQNPFIAEDSFIELKSGQNFFSFDFSTLSILNNKDLSFSYKLEGMNDEWIDCGARQTAYFTNIPGGNYEFRVRARNGSGAWKEAAGPVRISIDKVFYATIWFKLFLLLLLLLVVLWYIRFLRRRAMKKEADKAISYFANSMYGKDKVEDLLWDITHNVITRTNLVDCVVYLLDEKRNVLVQKAAYGSKNPSEYEIFNRIEIPVGTGIVGSVAKSGKAELVADTSRDPRYIADDSSRLSELAVPIIYEGKVIGVIDSEHPEKKFFTGEHLHLLQTIASISGTKIANAQKQSEILENEKRLEDLKTQITAARQQALQAQMNPHFIFNCLNSINGFILKNDSASASTFLIKFSKLIRLILEHSNEKAISLQSELDALKLYIEMEMLRFEKKFTCEIIVDNNVMADLIMVPPLIFQPFVENSIWHGLLHKESEGELKISVSMNDKMLECCIEDNGIGREAAATFKSGILTKKNSLGLKLTNERLTLLNEHEKPGSSVTLIDKKDASGVPCGTKVIISISLINQFHKF